MIWTDKWAKHINDKLIEEHAIKRKKENEGRGEIPRTYPALHTYFLSLFGEGIFLGYNILILGVSKFISYILF
jgi:hypothetical protein